MMFEASAWLWLGLIAAALALGLWQDVIGPVAAVLLGLILLVPALVIALRPLRRALVSPLLLRAFQRTLPTMSATERDALEAGTTWWDAELFSGHPNWTRLLDTPASVLSAREQAFLDGEVEQLCAMVSDWEVTQVWQDLPPHVWRFIKDKGFLGMIIPRRYGGLEFSAAMHSRVVMKLSTRCSALAVSVMVPNSLGPAELLLHYGTEEQKNFYLPRLASGDDVPCFALTSPYAGSDAAAIPDTAIVCRGMFEGRETLGLRLTWDKRYITLGPVATVLGLAVQTLDPDGLLGGEADRGISCVLIPAYHEGVVIGRRHWPLNAVFQNGPTSGHDVFIPIEWVIGGREQIGRGWRMLMECLAAGRSISLPSSNVGAAKLAVRGTSAYSAVRRQFKTAIGKFEGIQEALARMGGHLYMMDATRRLSAAAVDLGEKPAVISAIAKYHVTERARLVINDAMDVLGGRGICMGPNNFLARAYQQIPIGITVEGANILTRCLIIFGQGAIRCHPYVLTEMRAAADPDAPRALVDFDAAIFSHAAFIVANRVRCLAYSLSGGLLVPAPRQVAPEMRRYYRAVGRLSAAFALATDVSMLVIGGALKRREQISGRLGDVLSQMYLICATLKRFEDEHRAVEDAAFVHWSIQDALVRAQLALFGVAQNFPNRFVGFMLRMAIFPLGMAYRAPSDALARQVASAIQTPGAARERLLADCYVDVDLADPIACGERALEFLPQVEAIEKRLKPAIRSAAMEPVPQSPREMQQWIARAALAGMISDVERRSLVEFARLVDRAVRVDDFPADLGAAADARARQLAAYCSPDSPIEAASPEALVQARGR
jgi:acyl-CoA dehydrogenase